MEQMHRSHKEHQQELQELLEYADAETLRMIYTYLAPVELSLTPQQEEALDEPRMDDDETNEQWAFGMLA